MLLVTAVVVASITIPIVVASIVITIIVSIVPVIVVASVASVTVITVIGIGIGIIVVAIVAVRNIESSISSPSIQMPWLVDSQNRTINETGTANDEDNLAEEHCGEKNERRREYSMQKANEK